MTAKLSLETLKNIPEGQLTDFIWDFYLDHFNGSPDSILPRGFRIAKLTISFSSEMDNGGIRQFITNHTCGMIADPAELAQRNSAALAEVKECLEALTLIGANESAELLKEALALFQKYGWPSGPAPDEDEIDLLEFDTICESIDDRWFKSNGPETSSTRDWCCGEQYLREHLEDCVID
jgi:hypothetical protein